MRTILEYVFFVNFGIGFVLTGYVISKVMTGKKRRDLTSTDFYPYSKHLLGILVTVVIHASFVIGFAIADHP